MELSGQALLTLAILAAAIFGFIREKYPPDLVAMLAVLSLMVTRILDPGEAFSGFAHPATVSVAAVLILSNGLERTGALTFLARRFFAPFGGSEFLLTALLMVLVGGLSAFINNTAAVAVFIPVVLDVCRRQGASPGRVLMPMSLAATFGGMCTLIGTSTNLVSHQYAVESGLPGFTMFELGRVGLPMLLAGSLYVLFVGRWFLPKNAISAATGPVSRTGLYAADLRVPATSRWVGKPVRPNNILRDFDVELVEILRGGARLHLPDQPDLVPGDTLRVRGSLDRILAMTSRAGLSVLDPSAFTVSEAGGGGRPGSEPHGLAADRTTPAGAMPPPVRSETPSIPARPGGTLLPDAIPAATAGDPLHMAELVILPGSWMVGRTLEGTRFAERYHAVVLAIHRPGGVIEEAIHRVRFHPGDVLVLEGPAADLQHLADTPGYLAVGAPERPAERPDKLRVALVTLLLVILAVSFNILPIVIAACAGCAALVLTGCLRPREAYQAVDWSVIFMLAGALALGSALEKTGVTVALADGMARANLGNPHLVIGAFFVVAMVVSEFMSNSATVALLAPVAVSSAQQLGMNPMAVLAAITFGASAAFAMPIGYQTSLMIYGPGGYRFRDYVRMGIPLDCLLAAIAIWLIPKFWPLVLP